MNDNSNNLARAAAQLGAPVLGRAIVLPAPSCFLSLAFESVRFS